VPSLAEALEDFNSLRRVAAGDANCIARLDRLAQATFRAEEHLIVYGSLSPGGPNHWRLTPLGGTWEPGWVEGEREAVGWGSELGFPALRWRPAGPRVAAHLLRSAALQDHWEEIDRFEGAAYQRILVPFYSDQGLRAVGYLYAAATNGRRVTGA
jgi:gamma-glutamylcyclotransferase (GGCT)/AIG2-like uncharacterized protein YtfP